MPELISLPRLAIAFVPVLLVLIMLYRTEGKWRSSIYAVGRMLAQLLLIGFVLTAIFTAKSAWVVAATLLAMIAVASWIALRTIPDKRWRLYPAALVSVGAVGGTVLVAVVAGVLNVTPWTEPRIVIPLAGMIFANCMNSISLAADRYYAEAEGNPPRESAQIALNASLIPTTNSLFAVGLVSIPGMMTGQVLAGVSPYIAARYQIMVMCMVYGSAGLSAALFLQLLQHAESTCSD